MGPSLLDLKFNSRQFNELLYLSPLFWQDLKTCFLLPAIHPRHVSL